MCILWLLLNTCSKTSSFADESTNILENVTIESTSLKSNRSSSKYLERFCPQQTVVKKFYKHQTIGVTFMIIHVNANDDSDKLLTIRKFGSKF